MRRGQVYWYRFPAPDKRRPVLVLTRSDLVPHLATVTVAMITSTIRGAPSEVTLGPDDGLPRPCAVNLHNVFTLRQRELGPYLATVDDAVLERVDRALVFALGVGERSR